METPSKNEERRRFRRLPAAELHVAWRPRKALFSGYTPTRSHDFTREGLSIIEKADTFKIGDRAELKLRLTMSASSITLDRVIAQVVNERQLSGNAKMTRFGLAFDFTGSRLMRSQRTSAQLGRIEGILERGEKLRLRLQPLENIRGLAERV